ncbi:MAG: hypothetical protein A3I39_02680 [Candidatus Yanofskybacteria bacterium RIFCSPLOWO2_02_FULL_47_9b]|uniref:Uncharacterized protein n=1 Tax=Candidatus Yanofskybacteria bacterium RIFCSPLOWO2_02_FULL_47_9b TaxID=1802708 RepID=A0A1F8HBX3_9BACT|nr:MAG: hypothetical protein A3I39_02680 [Candidatus Yanofskybacteria bacterium RIFCSPLOWO2_02_FULL_47_9b]
MYLIIPLLLIILSAGGIVYIVHRKMPYLKKLTPESHEISDNILWDFFPELMTHVNEARFKQYQKSILQELEKLIRRLRVVTLKVDHISDRLIKNLRHRHISAHLEHKALLEEKQMSAEQPLEDFNTREQKLIVEIARNPKDPELYIQLGDLYLAMHNVGEAKESFEAALALNPHDLALARKYSQLLKKTEPVA